MALHNQARSIIKANLLDILYKNAIERDTVEEIKVTNFIVNVCNTCREPGDFFLLFPAVMHSKLNSLFQITVEKSPITPEFTAFLQKNDEYITLLKEQYTVATLLRS